MTRPMQLRLVQLQRRSSNFAVPDRREEFHSHLAMQYKIQWVAPVQSRGLSSGSALPMQGLPQTQTPIPRNARQGVFTPTHPHSKSRLHLKGLLTIPSEWLVVNNVAAEGTWKQILWHTKNPFGVSGEHCSLGVTAKNAALECRP